MSRTLLTVSTIGLIAATMLNVAAFGAGSTKPIAPDRRDLMPLERVAAWTSPPVDASRLTLEDSSVSRTDGVPYRIGYPMAVDLSPLSSGTWEALPDGDRIWRLVVRSQGARWLVLGFDVFRLRDGGELRAYTPGLNTVLGPFTIRDVRDHGELWLPPVAGDTLVLELLWPRSLAGLTPKLHLGTVSHGYKPFGTIGLTTEDFGDAGACNIDTMCPLGANWQDEKRGVVMLLSGGSGFCSGSLINTTADDCRPYVLTAAHCGAGTSTAYGFNFERPACSSGTPAPPTTQAVTGGTRLANYSSSDFTLMQMSAAPPEEFNAYFNGWSRLTTPPAWTIVIHHPRGDAKKISLDDDPATNGTNYGPNHWRIEQYELGTTEPGSSGSPLFDENSRIIGQLHGGTASCTSITWDEYGKVDASWIGGGTPDTRLRDWLDPEGTGAMVMDGVDWSTCAFNPAGIVTLARERYSCNDTLVINLRDDSLRGNPTQTVTVASATEPTPETVTLSAIEPGSGRFVGTFPVAAIPPSGGDGVLSVTGGDTITVTYIDADDGSGGQNVVVTATAVTDCTGPAISGITVSNVTGNGATVAWTTDEASNSVVQYGAVPPGGSTATSAPLVTSHSIRLTGLNECTNYFFWVRSTDSAGNEGSDNNGGAYYTFRTGANVNPSYTSTDTPVAIPDNNPAGASSVITVNDPNTVMDVDVTVNITHTYDGDISLYLIGPNGTQVQLSNRRGGSGDNFTGTTFDDEAAGPISGGAAPFAGSFIPEQPLSALDGISALGNWTFKVVDQAGADVGTIDTWTLTLTFPAEPCGAGLTLDAPSYSCTGVMTIKVKDGNVVGTTISVTTESNTETAPETVTLTRQAPPFDAYFQGTQSLTGAAPVSGDGLLSVVDSDLVTVTYIDADDGQGGVNIVVTTTAATDCVSPVISNVSATGVTGNRATINWLTNEDASTIVHYGLAIPPDQTASAAGLVQTHALTLTGLLECQTYYYSVESRDAEGNVVIDNNGGAYYTFETLRNSSVSYASTDTPVVIPDNTPAGGVSTIAVGDTNLVADVNVTVNVAHTFTGDVVLTLIGPGGQEVTLAQQRGSAGDNFTNTVFDDSATTPIGSGTPPFTGSFRPESPLSALNGIVAAGDWKLRAADVAAGIAGTLTNWTLSLEYVPGACGAGAAYLSNTRTDTCPSGGPGSGDGVIDRGENVVMPVTIRNAGTTQLTGVSATLSTTTPGVTITRATAAYPNITFGGTGTSLAPHFAYTVGPTVPCGSNIDFQLLIASDQGTFPDAFSAKVGQFVNAAAAYNSTDTPKPIPDVRTPPTTSTIAVAATGPVAKVRVRINLTHTWDSDLDIFLVAPNGGRVELSTDNGSSGDNYTNTWFDDAATGSIAAGTAPFTGTYRPEGSLATLIGIPATGNWTLEITDDAGGDSGNLLDWTLELTTPVGDVCTDCAPAVPSTSPQSCVWAPGKVAMTWEAIADATYYNVYRGSETTLPALVTAADDSCLKVSTPGLGTGNVLTETPAAGSLHWFIVRAANAAGEGPAGNATAGLRTLNSTGACP